MIVVVVVVVVLLLLLLLLLVLPAAVLTHFCRSYQGYWIDYLLVSHCIALRC